MLSPSEVRVDYYASGVSAPLRATHIPTGLVVIAKPGEQKRVLLKRLKAKILSYAEELVDRHIEQHGADILKRATGSDADAEEIRTLLESRN